MTTTGTGRRVPLPIRGGRVASGLILTLTVWLLTATRWGSYLSIPHTRIYVSEWFILAAGAVLLLTGGIVTAIGRALSWRRPLVLGMALLVIWSVARLVTSPTHSLTALRDFAPYGYAVCGLIVYAFPPRDARGWRALLIAALVVHAGWMTFSAIDPTDAAGLPTLGQTRWLAIRYDVDSAIAGVAAGLAVLNLPLRRGRWWQALLLLAFAAWNVVLAVTSTSRSGLLACATVVAFALIARVLGLAGVRPHRRPAIIAGLAVVIVLGVAGALASPGGQRLLESGTGGTGAAGTTHARQVAYDRVTTYVEAKRSREIVGVGFGPDFLADSGAASLLEGNEYHGVRSPHDYELGTWARLGIPGVVITLWLTCFGIAAAVRQLRRPTRSLWSDTGALLAVVVPIVAAFGVVLESPFGAIPYFVGLGLLISRPADDPRTRRLPTV